VLGQQSGVPSQQNSTVLFENYVPQGLDVEDVSLGSRIDRCDFALSPLPTAPIIDQVPLLQIRAHSPLDLLLLEKSKSLSV
jgi:hypothetical protein